MGKKVVKDYPQVVLWPDLSQGRIDFMSVFGRSAPIHIEVGSGKGAFLVGQAEAHPEMDFLGIEWTSKFYRYTVDRIGRHALANVRMIRTDASLFLRDLVSKDAIDGLHVYFPDPWPKRHHHRRRFLCPENVEQIIRVLVPGGRLQVVTDHDGYYEYIQSLLAGFSNRINYVPFQPTAGAGTGEWVGTNFERKYLKEERAFYAIAVEKKR
jgi:tRNA (guanine-N7-)-methyltransferase